MSSYNHTQVIIIYTNASIPNYTFASIPNSSTLEIGTQLQYCHVWWSGSIICTASNLSIAFSFHSGYGKWHGCRLQSPVSSSLRFAPRHLLCINLHFSSQERMFYFRHQGYSRETWKLLLNQSKRGLPLQHRKEKSPETSSSGLTHRPDDVSVLLIAGGTVLITLQN